MLKNPEEIDEEDAPPSKTRRKKDMIALQQLGEELVELNPAQLEEVPLPERLREAIVEARRITQHEAKRRQMQYVGRLMRDIDAEPVREKLASWKGVSQEATALLHRVERWRDRLLAEEATLGEFANLYPQADLQHLRSLLRSIRKEREEQKAPKHFRELFRVLRETISPPAEDEPGPAVAGDDPHE